MSHVASAPHELRGNLIYTAHGLSPYWTLVSMVFQADGHLQTAVDVDGETWDVQLAYQKGGIAPRPSDDIDGDRLYEVRLNGSGRDERKADFLVQPRFPDMRHYEDGHQITSPFDRSDVEADEGVNVTFQGSNLEPDVYPRLLPRFLQAVADAADVELYYDYLAGPPHEFSNITSFERYVRIRREMATKIVAPDGTFRRLFDLCARQEGSKVVYSADDTEIEGYNHQLRLWQPAARDLAPGHRYGKQLKVYHPKKVREADEQDDALYHPKVDVLYSGAWNDGESVRWRDRDALTKELEETAINLLSWSDVPVRPGGPTFVGDDHFDPVASERDVGFYTDPTPEIEASQEATLVRRMQDLTDADVDVLETMVRADGGREMDVGEVAADAEPSIRTIYRTLKRARGILENENGTVRFASEKLYQDVAEIVEATEQQVRAAATAVGQVLDMDPRQLGQKGSAFQEWLSKYAVQVETDGRMLSLKVQATLSRLGYGGAPSVEEVLEAGREAWARCGGDPARFRDARVTVTFGDETAQGRVRGLLRQYATGRGALG